MAELQKSPIIKVNEGEKIKKLLRLKAAYFLQELVMYLLIQPHKHCFFVI